MPKPAVPGCPSTGGEFFLSVVSYVAKRKKGLASWRSPFCFSGTNAPVDVVTLFQPTPPARGTTGGDHLPIPQYHISIHAPARGATLRVHDSESQGENFNPPPPRGGRLRRVLAPTSIWHFNPRPTRGGRLDEGTRTQTVKVLQSTPPRGGRPPATSCPPSCSNFNPRPP